MHSFHTEVTFKRRKRGRINHELPDDPGRKVEGPEGEEKEKGTEKIFKEIAAENFPNMGKEPLTQIHKVQ